jgi:hypothetical protein
MSPALVGFLRGLILTIAASVVAIVIGATQDLPDDLEQAWWAPFIILALRTLEGVIDKARGQAPQILGGSKPVDPDWYQKNYMGE